MVFFCILPWYPALGLIQTLRAGYREGYRKNHEITSKYVDAVFMVLVASIILGPGKISQVAIASIIDVPAFCNSTCLLLG
jgi:hypothetical protein